MPLPTKLDHCVIHVSDWERSNAFYRDVIGAELVARPVGFAYRFGDKQLNVHGKGVSPAEVARLPLQELDHHRVLHQVLLARPARHHHQIELRTLREGDGRHDLHAAIGGDRVERMRNQKHLGVGQPRQHLVGPGHVELGEPREDQHSNDAFRHVASL